MTISQVQRGTSSTQFVDWMNYLDEERYSFRPEFAYMAQIAMVMCKVFAKKSAKIELEDFLLKFGPKEDKVKHPSAKESKRFWSGLLALAPLRKKEHKNGNDI